MFYTIHITRKCNMICDYCYENDKRDINFSINEIENKIQSIAQNLQSNDCTVEILGGEPLLYIDGIEYVLKRVNAINSNTKFIIVTNGTIINDRIINTLNNYKITLIISIDGNRFMHDASRHLKYNKNGTYKIISKNIEKYLLYLHIPVQANLTLNKYNMPFLYDGIKDIYNKGINKINLGVVFQDINEENLYIITQQMKFVLKDTAMPKLCIPQIHEDLILNEYIDLYTYKDSKLLEEVIRYNVDENNFMNNIKLSFFYKLRKEVKND